MEQNNFNKQYRDSLAAKLREDRSKGNSEKAQKTLEEQRSTIMYEDAKKDHQSGDQLETRNTSIEAKIQKLKDLQEKINKGKESVKEATSLVNIETEKDSILVELTKDAREKFQKMKKEKTGSQAWIRAHKEWRETVKKVVAHEEAHNPEVLEDKHTAKKGFDVKTAEINKQQTNLEIEDDSNAKDTSVEGSTTMEMEADLNDQINKAAGLSEEELSYKVNDSGEILKTDMVNESVEKKGENNESYSEWSDAELLDEYKKNKEMLEGLGKYAADNHKILVSDIEKALHKRGLVESEQKEEDVKEKTFDNDVNEKKENSQIEKTSILAGIKDSAKKTLAWLNGKNSPWATPSMIAREERKLRKLKSLKSDNDIENEQDLEKKTAAAGLVLLEERNSKLREKNKKGSGWFKRNWKRAVLVAGVIGLLSFGPNSCETAPTMIDNDDTIENVEKTTKEVSVTVPFESGDGFTQLIKKSLTQNNENSALMRTFSGMELPTLVAENFKDLAENMNLIIDGKEQGKEEIRIFAKSGGENIVGGDARVTVDNDGKFTIEIMTKESLEKAGSNQFGPKNNPEVGIKASDNNIEDNIDGTYITFDDAIKGLKK